MGYFESLSSSFFFFLSSDLDLIVVLADMYQCWQEFINSYDISLYLLNTISTNKLQTELLNCSLQTRYVLPSEVGEYVTVSAQFYIERSR